MGWGREPHSISHCQSQNKSETVLMLPISKKDQT
jgi:hypothetical protein